ncbi:hypothetical protein [Aurantiacibacter atlanticus]|nr:hypothetical protein [Aurantiacibacter atlanticus]
MLTMAAAMLAGCSASSGGVSSQGDSPPFHAGFSAAGYATIRSAPPAPFTPAEPVEPQPPTAEEIAAGKQFQRVADFQNSVMDEVSALQDRLRRAERGNFVSVYYENEGDPSVVFQFLRAGPATLRKYTQHPRFFGKTVRWSMEQMMADADWMWATFGDDRVMQSSGIGASQVDAYISVSEADFRALVKRKGVTIPESVTLHFNTAPVVPINNPPRPAIEDDAVPSIAAPHIRIFPRADRPQGSVNLIESRVLITLEDGCFRAPDRDNALVLFPLGAQLFVDSDNYLAFASDGWPGYARVGEAVTFTGSVNEVSTPELVGPIHAACGSSTVIAVGGTASAAASSAQDAVSSRASTVRSLRSSYGIDADQAERAVVWLERRQAAQPVQRDENGIALPPLPVGAYLNSPPRPVMDAAECPPGSSPQQFICRTPEGWMRPLPDWLKEFLEQDR